MYKSLGTSEKIAPSSKKNKIIWLLISKVIVACRWKRKQSRAWRLALFALQGEQFQDSQEMLSVRRAPGGEEGQAR
eukprot:COSAG05_NODE_18858_length_301_cov_1.153465_1_plen_75_part_10